MSDETPTLRLGSQGSDRDATGAPEEHWAFLMLGEACVGSVTDATAECITALAAALDPATTARLFDQRDAAITERDRLLAELKALKNARILSVVFGHHKGAPRPFALYRQPGRVLVALGAEFDDDAVALRLANGGGWTTKSDGCAEQFAADDREIVWLSDELDDLAALEQRAEAAEAEVELMRPVLEAAQALAVAAHRSTDADPADATDALLAAVDVYNQSPNPDGETEVK